MSLARALTTRRKEQAAPQPAYMGRAASQRGFNARPIKRSEISLPVSLLSTTNMLSYEAPDIVDAPHVASLGGRHVSSNHSVGSSSPSVSGEDSDRSGSIHSHDTDATSVDMNSPDLSEANHLDQFFKSSGAQRSTRSTVSSRVSHSSRPSMDYNHSSPKIPTRAPSHSKNAHVLSHQLSVQRMATPQTDAYTRNSHDMFNAQAVNSSSPAPVSHPFGNELAQLNEAAEEFGYAVRSAEAIADAQIMRSKGLVRFCANEYMLEISSAYSHSPRAFEEDASVYQPMVWI